MDITRIGNSMAVAACFASFVTAQDQAETCYGPGSVVGAVVGTLIVTLGLLLSGFFLYKMYWKNRKGKHLVLMTDSENPHDQYAFDNPCFREATPIKHSIQEEKQNSKLDKTKWPGWPPVHTFGKERKSEKITSMDDSCLNGARLKVVNLKSHDFTGLGFNICGNMRDGIFVKDVLHRGPAFESGCINTGDRIDSVCISFRNMVFEDALTILSYASPYDVQVQVENDACSRPSTLMRSKRESNALKNSSDRILHPKFIRSQSFYHLNEMDKSSNKKLPHQTDFLLEKNRINHSLNKSQDFTDCPTLKVSTQEREGKAHKNVTPKRSPAPPQEKSHDSRQKGFEAQQTKSSDPQNKLQKLGIRVLPVALSPKSGARSEAVAKGPGKSPTADEDDRRPRGASPVSPEGKLSRFDEQDAGKENVKAILSKGFLNLKEKISQNSLGRKRKGDDESGAEEARGESPGGEKQERESDCPVPKLRSSVTGQVKEQNHRGPPTVPEEVCRAGDVARNNRKSVAEARKSLLKSPEHEEVDCTFKTERGSDSEGSSDRESVKDEAKRLKRSKGKAPAPPKQTATSKEISEIKRESELLAEGISVFKNDSDSKANDSKMGAERNAKPSYESDSDAEPTSAPIDSPNTKIELNATQVTVHQSPTADTNDDDVEHSRKAASLGDLSKLDSEQPLSIVLERAVSLDLTEGTSQCGKKRKAPLPPSEEFSPAFDDLNYRKEPRLEGLNTFQRRLKKSSDFGTLEDALCEGPKSLESEVKKPSPLNLAETHNHNIQEFSSWLAECRRPKPVEEHLKTDRKEPTMNSTSLVNINSSECVDKEPESEDSQEFQGTNVSFSVNGKNLTDFEVSGSSETANFPGANSRTVVVISQPASLEPAEIEKVIVGEDSKEPQNGTNHEPHDPEEREDGPPKLPSSPMPSSNTLSSPLSSSLTYITEIKVSTSDRSAGKPDSDLPSPNFVGERIQQFDSPKGFLASSPKNHFNESSKIPVRTMKSETGQKVLATIQSLAKESIPPKPPEAEYARRMASLFSSNFTPNQGDARKNETIETEIARPNVSGLYLKTSPPKPSKDYLPTRKVPPVVPPRRMETSLTSKSMVTVERPSSPGGSQGRNVVTFSSFVGNNRNDGSPSISFNIKEHGEVNGKDEGAVPPETSATKIVLEGNRNEEGP